MEEALGWLEAARRAPDSPGISDVFRWSGIVLDGLQPFEPTKDYIRNSFDVREHWLRVRAACVGRGMRRAPLRCLAPAFAL